MKKIFELVPKDKHDISSIEKLSSIDIKEVEPILEDLMIWIQDINWPVAKELIKVLPRFHLMLVPVIHNIFETGDDVWKSWTLELLRNFPRETLILLKPDLERMVNFPTSSEILEYVTESANEILNLI